MSIHFSNPNITVATTEDIEAIVKLLNSAYRGETSKQGWTTEANIIAGDKRTDEQDLLRVMKLPHSVLLKYTNNESNIIGCVNLQQHDTKIYLGMLSVSPTLQSSGIGKQLLKAAQEYALQLSCTHIYMSVIAVRKELIDWYKRNGYEDTGERKPFFEDGLTGKHLQPLSFMIMEKIL
jgi:ribosomal protein S18 acetylase RimI-like enzyme